MNDSELNKLYAELKPILLEFVEKILPNTLYRIEFPFCSVTIESK